MTEVLEFFFFFFWDMKKIPYAYWIRMTKFGLAQLCTCTLDMRCTILMIDTSGG